MSFDQEFIKCLHEIEQHIFMATITQVHSLKNTCFCHMKNVIGILALQIIFYSCHKTRLLLLIVCCLVYSNSNNSYSL